MTRMTRALGSLNDYLAMVLARDPPSTVIVTAILMRSSAWPAVITRADLSLRRKTHDLGRRHDSTWWKPRLYLVEATIVLGKTANEMGGQANALAE